MCWLTKNLLNCYRIFYRIFAEAVVLNIEFLLGHSIEFFVYSIGFLWTFLSNW